MGADFDLNSTLMPPEEHLSKPASLNQLSFPDLPDCWKGLRDLPLTQRDS